MIRGTCLICCELKDLNSEHIIPQCLGGVLEKEIYCIDCNGKLGRTFDLELAKNFGRYATLMNIKRARGDNQPFRVLDENTGLVLKFDGDKFSRDKPVINIKKNTEGIVDRVEVIARSQTELNEKFSEIAKKYNIDLNLVVFDVLQNPPPSSFYEFYLGGDVIYKAIAKIAYGFLCWKLPQSIVLSDSFSKIRSYLNNELCEILVSYNYEHTGFMTDNIRPLHKVHLSFNRSEKLIIGYVALFGVFRYTVLLSDCFESSIDWSGVDYTYNPITQKEVAANIDFLAPLISKEQVINPKQTKENILASLNKGMSVILEYSESLANVRIESAD